jgi:hypothetical protein
LNGTAVVYKALGQASEDVSKLTNGRYTIVHVGPASWHDVRMRTFNKTFADKAMAAVNAASFAVQLSTTMYSSMLCRQIPEQRVTSFVPFEFCMVQVSSKQAHSATVHTELF